MSNPSLCINDVLPSEILQKIFHLSAESFDDVLHISTTCRLWRKLIFNPFMMAHYWAFDNEHRKKDLVRWWNFNQDVNDPNDPFNNYPIVDCFLGKCVSLAHQKDNSIANDITSLQNILDRGSDYTVAFWLLIGETATTYRGLFMICDDDYDYQRSAGIGIDENNLLGIVFASAIGGRMIASNIEIKPNEWYHVVLVQERDSDETCPQQHLWINGKIELTAEVPIAAYSTRAWIWGLWDEWNRSLADLSLWSRRLSPKEIRAIYEQKTSIDKVDVTKYIFEHSNN